MQCAKIVFFAYFHWKQRKWNEWRRVLITKDKSGVCGVGNITKKSTTTHIVSQFFDEVKKPSFVNWKMNSKILLAPTHTRYTRGYLWLFCEQHIFVTNINENIYSSQTRPLFTPLLLTDMSRSLFLGHITHMPLV